MRIAVTGANGFIGRYVARELSRRGVRAVLVSRSELSLLPEHTSIAADLYCGDSQIYERLGRPEILIHLAWGGLPNYKSAHHFSVELPSQYKFLAGLIKSGLSRLVVTGTCFEYGMQSGALGEDLACYPSNPYGFAKDALRKQLEFTRESLPFELTWGRLFYIYGEGQSPNSLFTQLRTAALSGKAEFDMSGGEQLRDYLRVDHVAEAIVDLALSKREAGCVNICSGKPISVRRLVESWIVDNSWNIKLNLGRYPYPDYEPIAFWGTRTKLDKILRSETAS